MVCTLELSALRGNGERFPVELSLSSFQMDGRWHALGSVRDITERKMMEEELRQRDARFRAYFDLPIMGIAITSLEKGWIEVNDKMCDILGYSRQELMCMTWSELTHPEDIPADSAHFDRVVSGEIEGYSVEKRFLTGAGREEGGIVWTELSVRCVRKPNRMVDYFVALVQDITDRKRSEELALQSARLRAVADLSSGVAHHFNNLLQIVMGSASLSLADLESGDLSEVKTNLERMLRGGQTWS